MAEVHGVDLSAIQAVWVPPNVKFRVDDVESTWPSTIYDLIHIRHVMPVMRNVPGLLASTWEHLEPGGWLEVQEFGGELLCDDGTVPADSALMQVFEWIAIAISKFGISFRVTNHVADMCEDMGFEEISVNVIKTPVGMWPPAEV